MEKGESQVNFRYFRGIAIVLTLAAVLTTGIAPAQAAGSSLTLAGPRVIDYTKLWPQHPLVNNQQVIYQGTRSPQGGCQFARTGSLKPGGPAIAGIELAYDLDTCRDLVDVGVLATPHVYPPGAPNATGRVSASRLGPTNPAPTNSRSARIFAMDAGCGYGGGYSGCPSAVPGAVYSNNTDRAFADQWFDEPARRIDPSTYAYFSPVSEEVNAVEWTPDSACAVASGTTGWLSSATFWLTETGWYQMSNDWQRTPDPIVDCTQIFSKSYVHHQNRAFCALAAGTLTGLIGGIPPAVISGLATALNDPTDVYHIPVAMTGYRDGSANYSITWDKTGLCSALLAERYASWYY